jgi:hypothetical protein
VRKVATIRAPRSAEGCQFASNRHGLWQPSIESLCWHQILSRTLWQPSNALEQGCQIARIQREPGNLGKDGPVSTAADNRAEGQLRRWANTTPEQRREHGRKVSEAQLRRWAEAREDRRRRFAQRISEGQTRRWEEKLGPKGPDGLRHGRPGTYSNAGCRCADCRDAWRRYFNERRAQARAEGRSG